MRFLFLLAAAACAQDGPSLRGLSAVDANVAWASGSKGAVLRTVDGGRTWERKTVADLDFRDVEAWNGSEAVLMSSGPGDASRIYTTADGGTTWSLRLQNPDAGGFFDAIAFWDRKRGLLMGDPVDSRFVVMRTADGGVTWQRLKGPQARDREASFAASGTCLAVAGTGAAWIATGGAGGGRVFRSTDWGETWQVAETPIPHGSASEGIFSIAFPDARNGVAFGGDYQSPEKGSVAVTRDGGKTWQPGAGVTGYRSVVVPGLFAAGPNGVDQSDDGGHTWTRFSGEGFHAMDVAGGAVWAAGSGGRVRRIRP